MQMINDRSLQLLSKEIPFWLGRGCLRRDMRANWRRSSERHSWCGVRETKGAVWLHCSILGSSFHGKVHWKNHYNVQTKKKHACIYFLCIILPLKSLFSTWFDKMGGKTWAHRGFNLISLCTHTLYRAVSDQEGEREPELFMAPGASWKTSTNRVRPSFVVGSKLAPMWNCCSLSRSFINFTAAARVKIASRQADGLWQLH